MSDIEDWIDPGEPTSPDEVDMQRLQGELRALRNPEATDAPPKALSEMTPGELRELHRSDWDAYDSDDGNYGWDGDGYFGNDPNILEALEPGDPTW